jgi:hypothetical protein
MRSKYDTFVPANPPPEYTQAAAKKENGAANLTPTAGSPNVTYVVKSDSGTKVVDTMKIDILDITQIRDEDDNLYKLKIKDGALEIVKLNISGSTVTEADADFWNSGSES